MKEKNKKRIYLDHAAGAPLDKRVKKAMEPYFMDVFGNPNAIYKEGLEAREALDSARGTVAEVLGAKADEIIFTSGGTESDNLAILGVANEVNQFCGGGGSFASLRTDKTGNSTEVKLSSSSSPSPHIITTKFEHPAVLNACKVLEKSGFAATYLDVGKDGVVNPKDVAKALRANTVLVTIMYANNEIGTVQPIREIAKVIRKFRKAGNGKAISGYPFFHTDACQAPGYLDFNVERLGVDMLTLNGSKIYGPKGSGVLYMKRGIKIIPMMHGGEQEKGLRPGTENVAGIVGFAAALALCEREKERETKRLTALRDYLIKNVLNKISKTSLNGSATERLPNNANITFLDAEGEAIILYLDNEGIACSTGSACNSANLEPSHVITALGKPHEHAHGAVRFTLGRNTTKKDIDFVLKVLPGIVGKLRSFSPTSII